MQHDGAIGSDGAPGEPIRIGIVEDQETIREGLTSLVGGEAGFRMAGAWGSMEEALAALRPAPPHVLLVDIGLPGMSGIEGIRRLRESAPGLVTLVLTVYDDDERIFEALCAGASGYLLKKTRPEKLLESIREAVAGGAPISPEIARRVIALFRARRPPERADYNLTPHEQRLLKLMVDGHNYKSAAGVLKCSPHTVNFHVKSIYSKLQVHSRSEAVAKALRERVVD